MRSFRNEIPGGYGGALQQGQHDCYGGGPEEGATVGSFAGRERFLVQGWAGGQDVEAFDKGEAAGAEHDYGKRDFSPLGEGYGEEGIEHQGLGVQWGWMVSFI